MTNPNVNPSPDNYDQLVKQFKENEDVSKANLQKKMIDEPWIPLGNLHAMITKEQADKQKPLAELYAKTYLKDNDSFNQIYQLPSIKSTVDAYVKQRIDMTGGISPQELDDIVVHFTNLADTFKNQNVDLTKAKNKVGISTGQSSDGKLEFTEMDLEEGIKIYKERSKSAKGRKINAEFEKTPEGKKFLNMLYSSDPQGTYIPKNKMK